MFERYTEKARRVIFFARFEASQYGSPYIETEHLLLGLLREDREIGLYLLKLGSLGSLENLRRDIEAEIGVRERISTATEVPLTQECKRILNYAADEAEKLGHSHVGTGHLLLGILREETCFAARLLTKYGTKINDVRESVATQPITQRVASLEPAPIGSIVDRFLEAWEARDATRIAIFFTDRGQFWDVHGELWSTRPQIEKGLAAHFASAETREATPSVKDVKFVTKEVSIATFVWLTKETQESAPTTRKGSPLEMVLILRDTHPGWHVVSAHLAVMQLPKT